MRPRKGILVMGLVGVAAALAIAGTALAQTAPPTNGQGQAQTNYQQYFLDRLASALGIDRSKLDGAMTTARNETADKAVQDGRITQQQADKIKSSENNGMFGFGMRGPRGIGPNDPKTGVGHFTMGKQAMMDTIAKALGLSTSDLQSQLSSGKTLLQIAQAQNKVDDVNNAIRAEIKSQLDQAVANGKLTQDQANTMYSKVQQTDYVTNFSNHPGIKGNGNGKRGPAPSNPSSATPSARGAGSI